MTLDAAAMKRLRKEQAQVSRLWDFVAQTFAKRPFLTFAFWLHEEQLSSDARWGTDQGRISI